MSGGRRHRGRPVKQREAKRYVSEASSPHAARHDIVARYAILRLSHRWGHVVALCTQRSGRSKPGYPSREVAERVAELFGQLDCAVPQRVYLCGFTPGPHFIRQQHWHLASRKC